MSTASLLTAYETCPRKGFFARSWQPQRLRSSEMVTLALRGALTATEQRDWGDYAGSQVLQLAEDRGLDFSDQAYEIAHRLYDSVLHHACLADVLTAALRKPDDEAWLTPDPVQNWTSGCLLSPDGNYLRRLILVSHWSDERHYSECRSWYSLGEQAAYNLPMQLIVLVIGQQRDGLRRSPWTTGFLHPANRTLRFRKRSRSVSEVFNDKWEKVYREDHAEISRETWLNAMLKDDVLYEVCFRVDLPIPPKHHLQRIRDIRDTKLERIYALKQKPEANLSTCDWPLPCPFRKLCHVLPEQEPSEALGFVQTERHSRHPTVDSPISTETLPDPC